MMISVGMNGYVHIARVLAVLSIDTAPVYKLVRSARAAGLVLDGTHGRRTKAVLVLDTGHVLLSMLTPETVAGRTK